MLKQLSQLQLLLSRGSRLPKPKHQRKWLGYSKMEGLPLLLLGHQAVEGSVCVQTMLPTMLMMKMLAEMNIKISY